MPLGILCARRWAGWAVVVGMPVLVVLGSSGPAAGQRTWQGTPGGTYSWFDPMAWSGGVVPGQYDQVYINNGGAPVINGGAVSNYTVLGQNTGQSGGLVINAGSVNYSTSSAIGQSGYGWVIQNGGVVTTGLVYLGSSNRGTGEYTLNDGVLSASSSVDVGSGSNSIGSFKQAGGSHSTGQLCVGRGQSSVGSYSLSGGTLSTTSTYVGYYGVGTFTHTGGLYRMTSGYSDPLYIGYSSGAQGTYLLSGTGQILGNTQYVGYGSSTVGTFVQTGGINSLGTGQLYIANGSSSVGVYQLSGAGSVLTSGAQCVGYSGTGFFSQAGGDEPGRVGDGVDDGAV